MGKNANAWVSPPTQHKKKAYLSAIVAISPPIGQSQKLQNITQIIHHQELTTILEILAVRGIEENSAIFILANLQDLEVAA